MPEAHTCQLRQAPQRASVATTVTEPRIVASVRTELRKLDRLDTLAGQSALHLARLAVEQPAKAVPLLREVRAIVDALGEPPAEASSQVKSGDQVTSDVVPDGSVDGDELDAIRARRAAKSAQLGGAPS